MDSFRLTASARLDGAEEMEKGEVLSMKKIKFFALLFLSLCLIPLSSFAGHGRIDSILQRGTLVVGTTGHYPPLTVESKKGEFIGLDMDMVKLIAKAMGVKAEIRKMSIDELIPAIEKGKIDMAVAGLTITPKRNLRVAFVGPYFVIGQSLLTTKDRVQHMKGPDDINRPDFRLAVAEGTTGAEVARALAPKATVVKAKNMEGALEMLLAKKVDALMADQPFCVVAAFLNKDKGLASSDPFTFEPLGIALPGNDLLLMNWVQNFLMMLEANGQLKELKQYWFANPEWMDELPDDMRGKKLYQPVI